MVVNCSSCLKPLALFPARLNTPPRYYSVEITVKFFLLMMINTISPLFAGPCKPAITRTGSWGDACGRCRPEGHEKIPPPELQGDQRNAHPDINGGCPWYSNTKNP